MSDPTPTDPAELKAEIEQTRAELGDTVAALSAKTDVSGRAHQAASDAVDAVEDELHAIRDRAGAAAQATAERIRSEVDDIRDAIAAGDPVAVVRKPLPLAALAFAAGVAGLVLYLIRRRRS